MSFCCVYISCRISISHSTLNTPVMFILSHVNQCRLYDKSRDVYIQDCDDDGESAAGARLLHLLQVYLYHAHTSCSFDVSFLLWTQMMDVRNGMVVVSRWYVLISIWFAYFIGHAIRTLYVDYHHSATLCICCTQNNLRYTVDIGVYSPIYSSE